MMTEFILTVSTIVAIFFAGFWMGIDYEKTNNPKPKQNVKDKIPYKVYCFQCEWEMSTKEKNGQLYCGNCGLKH